MDISYVKAQFDGSIILLEGAGTVLSSPSTGECEIDFGSSYIGAMGGGLMEFSDNIKFTGNTACHIVGNGTIQNLFGASVPNEKIHAHGLTKGVDEDACDEDYIDFDKHTHPGTLNMMGVGI